jgi:hypothetical protein
MLEMIANLIGTLVGGCLAIVGSAVTQLIIGRRERKQQILLRKLDRFFRLEDLAGEITEIVGSYQSDPGDVRLKDKLNVLLTQAGMFRRYPEVKQAVRDLHNCANRLLAERRNGDDDRQARREIEQKYTTFLRACDEVIGSRDP